MKKSLLQKLIDSKPLPVPPDAPCVQSSREALEQLLQCRYARPFEGVHLHWVLVKGASLQVLFLEWPVAQQYLVEQIDPTVPGRDLNSCVDSILKRLRHLVRRYITFHEFAQGFANGRRDHAAGVCSQEEALWSDSDLRFERMGYRAGHAAPATSTASAVPPERAAWNALRAEARRVLEDGLPRLVMGEYLPLLDAERIWSDLTPA